MQRQSDFAAVGVNNPELTGDFDADFRRLFVPRLGHRAETMAAACAAALARHQALTIVETGCLRDCGNWAGDGQSTIIFDYLAVACGGSLFSVDIAPEAVTVAAAITSDHTRIALADSVAFLSNFTEPIDLLYLDSLDLDGNRPLDAAQHHLIELVAANRNLRPESVVAVDDTWRVRGEPFGKGMLIADYMRRVGAELIAEGYQMVWRITR